MPPMHRLLMPLILACTTACATSPPPVVLGLGPITAPQSLQRQVAAPDPLSPTLLASLPKPVRDAILTNQAAWIGALNAANGQVDDALVAFADYNRHLPREP